MQSFKMIFSGVTILQGVEFPIFPIDFAWALQQCSATALPVIIIIISSSSSSSSSIVLLYYYYYFKIYPKNSRANTQTLSKRQITDCIGLAGSESTLKRNRVKCYGQLLKQIYAVSFGSPVILVVRFPISSTSSIAC